MQLKVQKTAEARGVDCKVTQLAVGDYLWEDEGICIERKEIGDFMASIRSGHLETQLLDMAQYDKPRLFISGKFEDVYGKSYSQGWGRNHTVGSLCSINERYDVKILQFANTSDLIDAIFVTKEKSDKGKKTEGILRHSKTENVLNPNFALFLMIPGFGDKKAKEMSEMYKFQEFLDGYQEKPDKFKFAEKTKLFLDKLLINKSK